jgi:hypothetical protein
MHQRQGYAGYPHLANVLHAWYGAHLLRDLRGIHEADQAGQLWAKAMADTLLEAHRIATAARAEGRDQLTAAELRTIDRLYTGALARARTDNPATDRSVLAGHARTLAGRFENHRQTILRFTTNLAVGFTNDLSERQIRPVKVQQRSSGGCWRTLQGLADFPRRRSARRWPCRLRQGAVPATGFTAPDGPCPPVSRAEQLAVRSPSWAWQPSSAASGASAVPRPRSRPVHRSARRAICAKHGPTSAAAPTS